MGGEVADRAEALAGTFEASLAVADSHKQLLESAFRFESKGHVFKTIMRTSWGQKAISLSVARGKMCADAKRRAERLTNLFGKLN